MNYWLMKSEEADYSIDDLKKDGETPWVGVRNYQARNYMSKSMKIDDRILFYHSNGKPSAVVGVGKVSSLPYPDKTQFDTKSKYYYPRATKENPVWVLVDITFLEKFKNLVSIEQLRNEKGLKNMKMLQSGSRLSVSPVTKNEFETIKKLAA